MPLTINLPQTIERLRKRLADLFNSWQTWANNGDPIAGGPPSAGDYPGADGTGGLVWTTPSGGGSTTFIGLTDTPGAYAGSAGYFVQVNGAPDALIFRSPANTLSDIGGVPTSRTLTAGTGLTGGGDLTADRSFALANTAVVAGNYGLSPFQTVGYTVDAQGRITGAYEANIAIPASAVTSGTFATAMIANDAITDAKLRNSAALSVIGRSANSTGDPADIAGSTSGNSLRISGTTLGFGAIDLANANAVTGNLPLNRGGTNANTASGARTQLGLGTAATVNTGTSGAAIPLLNGANTHSGLATFTGGVYDNGGMRVKIADYTGGGTLTTADYYAMVAGASGITLPASPAEGQTLVLREAGGTNCTVNRNGNNINFAAANYTLPANGTVRLVYNAAVLGGWVTFAG